MWPRADHPEGCVAHHHARQAAASHLTHDDEIGVDFFRGRRDLSIRAIA